MSKQKGYLDAFIILWFCNISRKKEVDTTIKEAKKHTDVLVLGSGPAGFAAANAAAKNGATVTQIAATYCCDLILRI